MLSEIRYDNLAAMSEQPKTRWHLLLGKLLEELLTPVGIMVYTEFPVMSGTPQTDILLLRRKDKSWTPEQMRLLPDGIRDSAAEHILIEFKYTESLNEDVLRQALGYDIFYRRSHKLKKNLVRTFVISAKTPEKAFLEIFGYVLQDKKGVYHSSNPILRNMPVLLLNELSDEPYNAFIKCFASRMKEKNSAFGTLKKTGIGSFHVQIQRILQGLWHFWFGMKGEEDMKTELTPEKVAEVGRIWIDAILAGMSAEDIMSKIDISKIPPGKRLAGLKPEERLAGLKPEEIEAYLRTIRRKRKDESRDGGL